MSKLTKKALLICGSSLLVLSGLDCAGFTSTDASNHPTHHIVRHISSDNNQQNIPNKNSSNGINNLKKLNKLSNKTINPNSKNSKHSKKGKNIKKKKKLNPKYKITNTWQQTGGYDNKLNGRYLVCNKPSLYKSAQSIASRKNTRNMKVFTYRGKTFNHHNHYLKVINGSGKVQGWVKAQGVKHTSILPKSSYTSADINNYRNLKANISKSNILAVLAKDEHGKRAKQDRVLALKFASNANDQAKKFSNHQLKTKSKKLVKKLEKNLDGLKVYKASLLNTKQVQLSKDIRKSISSSKSYFNKASNHSNHSKMYGQMAKDLLNKASAENEQIKSHNLYQNNKLLLNAVTQSEKSHHQSTSKLNQLNLNLVKKFSNTAKINLEKANVAATSESTYPDAMYYVSRAKTYINMSELASKLINNNSNYSHQAHNLMNNIDVIYK